MNIKILFEDTHLIICVKPSGVPTQSSRIHIPDMVSLLKNHLRQQHKDSGEPYLAVIHRLDQPVHGILVFAKTPSAAKDLNRQLTEGAFSKHYLALLRNCPPTSADTLTHHMATDKRQNLSRICQPNDPDAKLAILNYKVVDSNRDDHNVLVKITLKTGRQHQIRLQFSAIGCPLAGDRKYGLLESCSRRNVALCAYRLRFLHPVTKTIMDYCIDPDF